MKRALARGLVGVVLAGLVGVVLAGLVGASLVGCFQTDDGGGLNLQCDEAPITDSCDSCQKVDGDPVVHQNGGIVLTAGSVLTIDLGPNTAKSMAIPDLIVTFTTDGASASDVSLEVDGKPVALQVSHLSYLNVGVSLRGDGTRLTTSSKQLKVTSLADHTVFFNIDREDSACMEANWESDSGGA